MRIGAMHESITEDRVCQLVADDENIGLCIACGDELEGCEPDAEGYLCPMCGRLEVYGAEQLLLHMVSL